MKFYDVKTRQSVDAEVTEKQEYQSRGQVRYAVKAKTQDGRSLTRFVSKDVYESVKV